MRDLFDRMGSVKQILQSLRDGTVEVIDVPAPMAVSGKVCIRTSLSLVSAGTERMLMNFGRANWVDKALQQPDRVKAVLDKVRSDGALAAFEAVRSKLDEPLQLGYCNVGTVVATGEGVDG